MNLGKRIRSWSRNARRRLRSLIAAVRYYADGIYNRAGEDQIFLKSGGIAYAFVLCFVPLSLIVFSIVGMVLERASIRETLFTYLDQLIPYPGFAAQVKSFVSDRVNEFRLHRTWTGLVGAIGLLIASSGLFGAIRTTLNAVYRIEDTLSILRSKLRDISMVLQALLLFLVSIVLFPLAEVGIRYLSEAQTMLGLESGFAVRLLIRLGSFVVVAIVYGLVYWSTPSQRPPFRAVLVSAISAALLLELAKVAFGIYVRQAVFIRRVYGAYLFGAAVALWIYYASIVFTVSAQIGRLSWERSRGKAK